MSWTDCRIIAFDTETTGLNPFDGDKVIEFAGVELKVNSEFEVTDVKSHDFLVNPGIPIPRESTKITGIADEHVANKPPFSKYAAEIRSLMEGSIVVAHNLAFDLSFLRLALKECGMYWPETIAEVDTLRLSQAKLSELKQHRLGVVAEALEISLDNAHRASDDAEACGRVFVEIARRKAAPSDLSEMIVWADAVSPPPATGHLGMGSTGVPVFLDGPHEGQTVEEHPDHLQWMMMALVRKDGRWQQRYPDSVHEWARRWLRARTSGRFRANPRGGGSQDWGLDPAPWRS